MIYELLLSDETRLDIFDAFLWYEEQREGLGVEFELCLDAGLSRIQDNPFRYQIRYDSVRVCFIERFPYGIHYQLEDSYVRIFGLFHTSMNPSSWFDRLN